MKSNTTGTNPAITAYDISTVFVGNNEFDDRSVTLASGANLLVGTVLGALTANVNLALTKSANTDGSEVAEFVLAEPISSVGGETKDNVRVCVAGKVDTALLLFDGTDTIDTIVSGKGAFRDLLKRGGIFAIDSTETSNLDNGASLT